MQWRMQTTTDNVSRADLMNVPAEAETKISEVSHDSSHSQTCKRVQFCDLWR